MSWAYVLYMAWGMANMDVAADWLLMPSMLDWDAADLLLVFVMWTLMMAAMMVPSAVPLLLLVNRINFERYSKRRALGATGVFALGYLTVWTGFSALATLAQWAMLEARLVSPMMESSSAYLSAALLLAAGAYQFSPLKHVCLSRCRSPLSFLMTQRVDSAFLLGLRHGTYCAGCCWLLMTLLFVLGVMNVAWIAVLTLIVLLEKVLRQPRWFLHLTGAALLLWGGLALAGRFFS
jgi:predicted metal-binding membrane protein